MKLNECNCFCRTLECITLNYYWIYFIAQIAAQNQILNCYCSFLDFTYQTLTCLFGSFKSHRCSFLSPFFQLRSIQSPPTIMRIFICCEVESEENVFLLGELLQNMQCSRWTHLCLALLFHYIHVQTELCLNSSHINAPR